MMTNVVDNFLPGILKGNGIQQKNKWPTPLPITPEREHTAPRAQQ